jgi:hypothetical protein
MTSSHISGDDAVKAPETDGATAATPSRGGRTVAWLAGLAAAILAPLTVWLLTERLFADKPPATLSIGRPTALPMTRGQYLAQQDGRDISGLPPRLLRQPGVELVANVKASGYEGDLLHARCWLYDVQARQSLQAEKLRLRIAGVSYLDPPCWRALDAHRDYLGFIAVDVPGVGERRSAGVVVRW